MSSQKETTHVLIARQLVIFRRPRSTVWQCRYQIDGRWQRNSTNQRELEAATKRAYELLVEANVRKKLDYAPITRQFKDIAHLAVNTQLELRAWFGKVDGENFGDLHRLFIVD